MQSVNYAECHKQGHYAECRYAECHYAECRYAECHYDKCCYAECRVVAPPKQQNLQKLH